MVLVKSSRVGVGLGVGGGGVEEGKVCSVAWQRQHLHHQQRSTRTGIKMAAQGGEALPVVELRPFTKRVWRREKSLPNFSEQPAAKGDSGTDSSRNGGIPPPPNLGQFLRELREQRRMRDASSRHSVDSLHRLPLKLHPKAEFGFDGDTLAEHRQDLIPSFVSRQDRSKTTLGEESGLPVPSGSGVLAAGSSNGYEDPANGLGTTQDPPGGLVRESSNLMAAYTRDKPLHHQNVCLMGDKITVTQPGRRHLAYLNPFPLCRQKQAWHSTRLENSPTALSPRQRVNISFLARDGRAFPIDPKDHLPTQDLVLAGSLMHTVSRIPQPTSTHRHPGPHRFHQKLGAAQDSFLALNRNGTPTIVEQNLSFDLEVRLERCRRERSFAAVTEVNALTPGHYLSYDSQPTPGETTLMKAREANKSQERRRIVHRKNGLDRSLTTLPSFLQQQSVFRSDVEDSPTSTKSQHGGSDRSSPGEPPEGSTRRADSSRPLSQNMMPTIQQLPVNYGTPKSSAKELHRVSFLDTVPTDNSEDVDSLVESTDEYQRPLSDTAATETVHVRNDQTPMSADNRARLLPRYDAYLEVIQTGREHVAHTQRMEENSKDLSFFQSHGVDQGAQQAVQMTPDAEAVNREADVSNSNSLDQSALSSMLGSSGPRQNESQGNDAVQRGKNSADSLSAKIPPSAPSQSADVNKEPTVIESGQCEQNQHNSDHQVSAQTSQHGLEEKQTPELIGVDSDVTSSERPDSRKDTQQQGPQSESLIQQSPTKKSQESISISDELQNSRGVSHLSANNSKESDVLLSTAKDHHQTSADHPTLTAHHRPAQEGLQDVPLNEDVFTDNAQAVFSISSMDDSKSISSEAKNTTDSVTEFSDINTTIDNIFPADHTEARSVPSQGRNRDEDVVSAQQKAEHESPSKASSSTDNVRPLSQSRKSPSSERPVSTEQPTASAIRPGSGIHASASSASAKSRSANSGNGNDIGGNDTDNKNSANNGDINENSAENGSTHNTNANNGDINEHRAGDVTTINSANDGKINDNSAENGTAINSANNGKINDISAENGTASTTNANTDGVPEDSDSDALKDVEPMVSVTMDRAESDNVYDASKTFLTTANVDSTDWKDMVTV